MSWKCENCGQKLTGKEEFCPNCNEKIVFKCKCGKELDNGKHKYCPVCNTKRTEKRDGILKTVVGGVAVAGTIVLAIVTRGKSGESKS